MDKKDLLKKILVVLLSLTVLAAVALLDPNVKDAGEVFLRLRPDWMALAVVCMLISYAGDALMLHAVFRLMGMPLNAKQAVITTMTGFFYSALTPFQSGGQPMQIIQLRAHGIPVGASTSALGVKFLSWQLSMLALATAGLFVLGDGVMGDAISANALLYVGYGLNMLLFAAIALALVFPDFIRRAGMGVLWFFHKKLHLPKNAEKYSKLCGMWENTIAEYTRSVDFLLENKFRAAPILLYGFIETAAYMLVTYCVYRAFGLCGISPVRVALLQAVLTIAVSFVPLPGASGASEGGFYLVFSGLFGSSLRFMAMLCWRFITYYLSIVLGMFAVTADGLNAKKKSAGG